MVGVWLLPSSKTNCSKGPGADGGWDTELDFDT